METKQLVISNKVEEIHRLSEFLEGLGGEWILSAKTIMQFNLVLEEIISNIIFYAWDDKKEHPIDLIFSSDGKMLTAIITDDGKPFDPLKTEDFKDIGKDAEERNIGGLGIHFVKELTDSVEYERKEEKNILIIKKLIK